MRGTLTDRDTDRSLLCLSLGACNLPDHIGVSAGGCPLCPRKRTSEPVSASTQQLRQLGDVRHDPPRLIAHEIGPSGHRLGLVSLTDGTLAPPPFQLTPFSSSRAKQPGSCSSGTAGRTVSIGGFFLGLRVMMQPQT